MNLDKEILWGQISQEKLNMMCASISKKSNLYRAGIFFPTQLIRLNIAFTDTKFIASLKEKFTVVESFGNHTPTLFFGKYDKLLNIVLPYKQYGYVSLNQNIIACASSFGVFKSVISGVASLLMEKDGYFPVHGSVLEINGKGIMFVGGTGAGKTSTLINLIHGFINDGVAVKVLTDDWAILKNTNNNFIAETFDSSISLKMKDINENPHLKFHNHDNLVQRIKSKTKISLSPDELYGMQINTKRIKIDYVILLDSDKDVLLSDIAFNQFAKLIVDTAYHYPYTNDNQVEKHINFWTNALSKLKVKSFSYRATKNKQEQINRLRSFFDE